MKNISFKSPFPYPPMGQIRDGKKGAGTFEFLIYLKTVVVPLTVDKEDFKGHQSKIPPPPRTLVVFSQNADTTKNRTFDQLPTTPVKVIILCQQ